MEYFDWFESTCKLSCNMIVYDRYNFVTKPIWNGHQVSHLQNDEHIHMYNVCIEVVRFLISSVNK